MRRILTIAAAGFLAFAAGMVFAGRPALAYGEAPWCAVYNMGWGDMHWECEYASIESCRPNILAGNRGFCNPNPYYRAPERRAARRHHRHHRHYR